MTTSIFNRLPQLFGIFLLLAFLPYSGCDKPETPPEGYGKIVEELPNIPDRPRTLPLPEGTTLGRNGVETAPNTEKTADSPIE